VKVLATGRQKMQVEALALNGGAKNEARCSPRLQALLAFLYTCVGLCCHILCFPGSILCTSRSLSLYLFHICVILDTFLCLFLIVRVSLSQESVSCDSLSKGNQDVFVTFKGAPKSLENRIDSLFEMRLSIS